MNSVRLFVGLWLGFTLITVIYAVVDLSMNPWLHTEQGISFEPDLSRIWEAWHWGGRLLRENPMGLVANAALGGGLLALCVTSLLDKLRGSRTAAGKISIYPASAGPSAPPTV